MNKFVFKPAPGKAPPAAPQAPSVSVPKPKPKPRPAPKAQARAPGVPGFRKSVDTEPMGVPVPPPPLNANGGPTRRTPPAAKISRADAPKPPARSGLRSASIGSSRVGKPVSGQRMTPARGVRPVSDASLDDELDALFEGATVSGDATAAPGRLANPAETEAEIRKLFGQIAAHHAAQLRDFFVELSLSPTSKQWADICAPALTSIRKAADSIGSDKLSAALVDLEKALDNARRGSDALITAGARDALLVAFGALTKILPEAFDLVHHRKRRDPVIVHTLLEQVPGISTLAIERVYGAGLSALDTFYKATSTELAAATGVDKSLCAAILARFADYRRGRAERAEHAEHNQERARLTSLVTKLKAVQSEFRDAELAERGRDKRRLRAQRGQLLQDVNLALAHLGQVALIETIARIPVDAKMKRIDQYLRKPSAGS